MKSNISINCIFVVSSALLLSTGVACSGGGGDGSGGGAGSGVSQSKQIKDLSANELMDLCTWGTAEMGGENNETDCGDGSTNNTGTVAECLVDLESSYETCDITVGNLEECVRALAADPCDGITSPGCAILLSCVSS